MKSQTERILEYLRLIRPGSLTASDIYRRMQDTASIKCGYAGKGFKPIPKVSVNRALNELKARGLILKKNEQVDSPGGRKEFLWRASYKE
jgi:hypothetical protein